MSDRAWEDLVDRIDLKFGISHQHKFDQPLVDDTRLTQTVDQVDFERDGQAYRIERISSPAIIDKKTNYNKVGIATSSHTVYDPEEVANKVVFYRLDGETAIEITPDQLLG